jgi:hypothetical protein
MMIAGEPRVVEQELVDANGDRVVCRPAGRSVRRVYHRVAPAAYESGRVGPACQCRSADEITRLAREADLSPQWGGCTREACFGECGTKTEYSTHSTALEAMSPEAFERALADESGEAQR